MRSRFRSAGGAVLLAALAVTADSSAAGQGASSRSLPLPCEASRLIPAPSADRLLVACTDRSLHVLSLADGRTLHSWPVASFPTSAGLRYDAAISDDGRSVAMAFFSGLVAVAAVDRDQPPQTLQMPFYPSLLRFEPQGDALWAGRDRVELGSPLHVRGSIPVEFDNVNDLVVSPDGKVLAAANADTSVRLYDAQTLAPRAAYTDLDVEPMVLAYSSRGASLLVGAADGRLLLFDAPTLRLKGAFRTPVGTYATALSALTEHTFAVTYGPTDGGASHLAVVDTVRGGMTPVAGAATAPVVALRSGSPWTFAAEDRSVRIAPLAGAPSRLTRQ